MLSSRCQSSQCPLCKCPRRANRDASRLDEQDASDLRKKVRRHSPKVDTSVPCEFHRTITCLLKHTARAKLSSGRTSRTATGRAPTRPLALRKAPTRFERLFATVRSWPTCPQRKPRSCVGRSPCSRRSRLAVSAGSMLLAILGQLVRALRELLRRESPVRRAP